MRASFVLLLAGALASRRAGRGPERLARLRRRRRRPALFAARPDRPRERRRRSRSRGGSAPATSTPIPPPPDHMAFQATPILVDGLLVLPTPLGRVLALDPATGAERWRFDATVDGPRVLGVHLARRRCVARRGGARGSALPRAASSPPPSNRGCSRSTPPPASSCAGFGRDGEVSLKEGVGEDRPWDYTISSPPTLAGDLVVVGSAIGDNRPRRRGRRASCAPTTRAPARSPGSGIRSRARATTRRTRSGRPRARRAPAPRTRGRSSRTTPTRDLVFVPTSSARAPTTTAACASATTATRTPWSRCARRRASWPGSSRPCTTTSGTTTCPRSRCSPRSCARAASFRWWCRPPRRASCSCCSARRASPCSRVEERPVPPSDVPGRGGLADAAVPDAAAAARAAVAAPRGCLRAVTPWDRGRCREKLAALRNEGIFTPPSLRGTLVVPGHARRRELGQRRDRSAPSRRILRTRRTCRCRCA